MHSKVSFKRLKRPLGSRVIGFARVGSKRVAAIGIGLLLVASGALAQQAAPVPPVIIALDGAPTNTSGSVHDFTGLPLTADGWTDLHGMILSQGYSDARIVYVSTSGNDSTAQVYSQSSAPLGGQPLNPSGQIAPFRTLNAAYERLRDGYPDVMLLRRGDSWGSTSITVNKSGRNNAERMIVGAYGPEGQARPIARIVSGTSASHAALSSVHLVFTAEMSLMYYGTNVLVEDFMWESPPGTGGEIAAAMLHGRSDWGNGGGAFRRNSASWTVFFSGWAGSLNTPSLFEENTISRCRAGSGKSNVYFAEDAGGIRSIRNQSLLTCNAGFRQRGALETRDSVVLENLVMGVQPGQTFGGGFDVHAIAVFDRNVSLHIPGPNALVRPRDASIRENIFTAYNSDGFTSAFTLAGNWDGYAPDEAGLWGDTVFDGNVFNSRHSSSLIDWNNSIESLLPDATITFQNNAFLKPFGGAVLNVATDPRVTFTGNEYFSTDATVSWFTGQTYAQMVPATGAAVTMGSFPDPNRNILTYMQSIGADPSSVDQALEWYSDGVPGNPSLGGAVANRRGAWDERFTAVAVINHVRQGFGLPPL